ncbi:hypothetical protein LTR37_008368 [Vermiconidia calcicola]|uniref:Uncharacterized protein n=1 Tax=Vermiconidia calcicola TaxID=1690605 RepID=A0ACC3NC24_9PEZI|nr:hypothetical protein LTR37_008368 [Vermiconidia calcicola]
MHLQQLFSFAGGWLGFAAAQSLSSTLASHSSFSVLYDVLLFHDMLSDVDAARDATYFAPNNDALKNLADFGINLTTTDPNIARAIIYYGLVNGIHSSDSIINAGDVQLVHSELRPPLFTNVTKGQAVKLTTRATKGRPSVVLETGLEILTKVEESDIAFANGLVHATSTNMVLPHNVSETSRLIHQTEFLRLMQESGTEIELNSLADMTLFIPHNEAISKFRPILDTLTQEQLAAAVTHHAIANEVIYGSTITGSNRTLETVGGGIVQIQRGGQGQIFVNNIEVLRSDLLLYGGVAHIIDGVLSSEPATSISCQSALDEVNITNKSTILRFTGQWITSNRNKLMMVLMLATLATLIIMPISAKLYRSRRKRWSLNEELSSSKYGACKTYD